MTCIETVLYLYLPSIISFFHPRVEIYFTHLERVEFRIRVQTIAFSDRMIAINLGDVKSLVLSLFESVDVRVGLLAATALVVLLVLRLILKSHNKKILRNGEVAKDVIKLAGWDAFGNYLDIVGCMKSLAIDGGILEMSYVVPEHLCHFHPDDNASYLDLAAILALTDEITSTVIVCSDKTLRPGVSVSLSGELYCDDIRAGQHILIEACVTKIGATLGFTEVCVYPYVTVCTNQG